MNAPNWKTCTEEELWKFVAFHLSKDGVESVLVGGAVVAIYSGGAYRSGDLDFVTQTGARVQIEKTLVSLGFESIRGRHFEHPECPHLMVEFPPGPIAIGDDYSIVPSELKVETQTIRIFSPTDCIRDRLASYIHFKARECLDQAVLVGLSQSFDHEKVKAWCRKEGAAAVYDELMQKILSQKKSPK